MLMQSNKKQFSFYKFNSIHQINLHTHTTYLIKETKKNLFISDLVRTQYLLLVIISKCKM